MPGVGLGSEKLVTGTTQRCSTPTVLLPMAVLWVADIGRAVVGLALDPFERCRHSPNQVGDFTLPVCRIADHRTGLVGGWLG